MKEWKLEKDEKFEKNGDYVIRDGDGNAVIIDTSYYPAAPLFEDAELIVRAVNFYLKHLEENTGDR